LIARALGASGALEPAHSAPALCAVATLRVSSPEGFVAMKSERRDQREETTMPDPSVDLGRAPSARAVRSNLRTLRQRVRTGAPLRVS
jgi:hypothetical protein